MPPRFIQTDNRLQNDPGDPAQLSAEVEKLKDLEQPEQSAMNSLHELLQSCGGIANQGVMPTGLNVEVTNGLLGENYRRIAYLPSQHPRINEHGELVDKWSTPYEFHFISSKQVEIISAGPDRVLYTDDDILLEVE